MNIYLMSIAIKFEDVLESYSCQSYPCCYFTDKGILLLHEKVDLVVTLGGDGTVLWVCDSISISFEIKDIINSIVGRFKLK